MLEYYDKLMMSSVGTGGSTETGEPSHVHHHSGAIAPLSILQ